MFSAHNVGGKSIMEFEEHLKKALEELRKTEKRKFEQTVDLIINLQKFDVKKSQINLFVQVPYKVKKKKIAGFFETSQKEVETITKNDFRKYSDKKEIKKLVKKFDFFISQASLMPSVATTFGRVLGPAGKMPSPQLGIILNPDEKSISELVSKINQSARIRVKEASVKMPIGKEGMKDEETIENISAIYNALLKALPKEKENIKNVEIKFTMTKPVKIKIR